MLTDRLTDGPWSHWTRPGDLQEQALALNGLRGGGVWKEGADGEERQEQGPSPGEKGEGGSGDHRGFPVEFCGHA